MSSINHDLPPAYAQNNESSTDSKSLEQIDISEQTLRKRSAVTSNTSSNQSSSRLTKSSNALDVKKDNCVDTCNVYFACVFVLLGFILGFVFSIHEGTVFLKEKNENVLYYPFTYGTMATFSGLGFAFVAHSINIYLPLLCKPFVALFLLVSTIYWCWLLQNSF